VTVRFSHPGRVGLPADPFHRNSAQKPDPGATTGTLPGVKVSHFPTRRAAFGRIPQAMIPTFRGGRPDTAEF
jgi:hypothetical protein